MHKQCVPGSFFSAHAPDPGNEAKHGTDIPTRPGETSEVAPAIAGSIWRFTEYKIAGSTSETAVSHQPISEQLNKVTAQNEIWSVLLSKQ